jgi:hypothetical protein
VDYFFVIGCVFGYYLFFFLVFFLFLVF